MQDEIEKLLVPRDGKSGFYRKLELDKHTMKLIRGYRKIKRVIDRDINVKSDVRET